MMEIFTQHFGLSISVTYFVFLGIALIGFGLGFAFWIGYRKSQSQKYHYLANFVWIFSTVIGLIFGYLSTQPFYFRQLTVTGHGFEVVYILPHKMVFLNWDNIESIVIRHNRLVITAKSLKTYTSPVIYLGDQNDIIKSIMTIRPS